MYQLSVLRAGEWLQEECHYHPEMETGLVLEGQLTMQLQGQTYTLRKGELYTAAPEEVHALTAFSPDTALLHLTFLPSAVATHEEHFFYKNFLSPLADGTLILPPVISGETELPQRLMDLQTPSHLAQRFFALMEFCLQLMPYCRYARKDFPDKGVENKLVRSCMGVILNNYDKPLRLQRLAKTAGVHPNYLCAVFKAHTGQTVFDYLTRFRIEVAAELLRKETLPVGKIAELVGIPSESLFYKKFRQLMGMTPVSYRKRYSVYSCFK